MRTKPNIKSLWLQWRRPVKIGAGLGLIYLAGLALIALTAHPRPSDLAVVLGNEVMADGRPSHRLAARLDAAVAVYRAGLAPRVLVSGGIESNGQNEARVMAAYLVAHGVPAPDIIQDPHGDNTFETARQTAALLHGHGRVLVVSQWFHIPRTELAMRRFGLRDVSGASPPFTESLDVFSFLREAVAIPVYAVKPLGMK